MVAERREGGTDLVNGRFDTGSLDYFLELLDVEVRDADAPVTQRLIRSPIVIKWGRLEHT